MTNFLLDIAVHHMHHKLLRILDRQEIRRNKLIKYPQIGLLRNLTFRYTFEITQRNLEKLWEHKLYVVKFLSVETMGLHLC